MMRRVFFWKSGESRLMEDFRVEADTQVPRTKIVNQYTGWTMARQKE